MKRFLAAKLLSLFFLSLFSPFNAFADDENEKIVNVYGWANEVTPEIAEKFEKETGIKVNLSYYENNEVMYAKLRSVKNAGYDVVMPSSYFVDRMRNQNMLEKLDKSLLPNFKNMNPEFLRADYDVGNQYSIPHVLGITGIFINTEFHQEKNVNKWSTLWDQRYLNQLLMLDDTREVFSIALLTLGYSVNDRDPAHIKEAFLRLKELMPNIKVFSSTLVTSILIDEDATIGMAWNGDTYKASLENANVKYIFPKDGFVIWVDTLVIPKNAPHKKNAYAFINFLMRPEIAKEVALATNFSIANLEGQKLLPPEIRNNPTIYPPKEVLKRGQFQTDVGEEALALLEKYWEELKMTG